MKDDGATLEPLAEDVDECGGFMSETTSDDEIEVGENDAVLNDQATTAADPAEVEDSATEPTEDDTSTEEPTIGPKPKTQAQIINDYIQRAFDKAEKEKAKRKRKKQKKKKKKKCAEDEPHSVSEMSNADIEETVFFGNEVVTYPGYMHLLQSSRISEQIRSSQGSAINPRLKLELDRDSGVFFGKRQMGK